MRARLLLVFLAALPASAGGQAVTGRISGAVHDSTTGRPLAGATVMVAGAAPRSVTDSQGRFVLFGVPSGPIQLFFLHPRLDTLEYTPRSMALQFGSDQQDVQLAIPSRETLARESCGSEAGTTRLLEGSVLTRASGSPVALAIVELKWRGGSARDTTSGYGHYRFCNVPAGERLSLHAELMGRVSPEQVVAREAPLFSRHDIRLEFGGDANLVKTSLRPSTGALQVMGQVRDSESGAPVAAAMLRLVDTPFQALSNTRGGFSFAHVPAGDYALEVEHIGYGKRQQRFSLPPGTTVELDVQLPPAAIALKELTVRALTSEENERRASPTANRIVGEAQLDAATGRGASIADVLRQHFTGLLIREGTFESTDSNLPQAILCIESKRGPASMAPPASMGQQPTRARRQVGMVFPTCDMIPVFVDDSRISAAGNYLRFTPLDFFVRIEYLPATAASLRYGLNAENKGVLALFTKHPDKRKKTN